MIILIYILGYIGVSFCVGFTFLKMMQYFEEPGWEYPNPDLMTLVSIGWPITLLFMPVLFCVGCYVSYIKKHNQLIDETKKLVDEL